MPMELPKANAGDNEAKTSDPEIRNELRKTLAPTAIVAIVVAVDAVANSGLVMQRPRSRPRVGTPQELLVPGTRRFRQSRGEYNEMDHKPQCWQYIPRPRSLLQQAA